MSEHQSAILSAKSIIRFSDCDPFDHLNNAKYIEYFLNAREDQLLASYQFSVYEYARQTNFGWVVGQHEIAYLQPASTMETVTITSVILHWGEKDILVEFNMWDENKTKLKAVMWTRFYYFDLTTNRSAVHPAELNEKFGRYVQQGPPPASFAERMQQIRSALRSVS